MHKLNNYIKNLKSIYRQIFQETAKEIECIIFDMEVNSAKEYLKHRLLFSKQKFLSAIKKYRNECSCICCGVCCQFAVSEFSPSELEQKALSGDNYASQFVKTFVPYNSNEDYKDIYPEYIELLRDEKYYVYHCLKLTENNRCSDYDNRPAICREFPDNPIAFLPPACGFSGWKLKSEPLYLRLRAETEIIEHFINIITKNN